MKTIKNQNVKLYTLVALSFLYLVAATLGIFASATLINNPMLGALTALLVSVATITRGIFLVLAEQRLILMAIQGQ